MSLFIKACACGCYGLVSSLNNSLQIELMGWNVFVCFSFWVVLALVVTSFSFCYLSYGLPRALILH